MNIVHRVLFCIAIALPGFVTVAARQLTDAETNILLQRNDYGKGKAAEELVKKLGLEQNLDVIPLLLTFTRSQLDHSLVTYFFAGYNLSPGASSPSEQLDSMVISMVQEPGFFKHPISPTARNFLFLGTKHSSPRAWQTYYDIVRRAFIDHSHNPAENQYLDQYDWGMATQMYSLLTIPDLPNTEEPIAALLPLMRDTCQGAALIEFLGRRRYAKAVERVRQLYERTNRESNMGCNNKIIASVAAFQTLPATELIANHLKLLVAQAPKDKALINQLQPRIDHLLSQSMGDREHAELADLQEKVGRIYRREATDAQIDKVLTELGSTRVEAQIDYALLAQEVLSKQTDPKRHDELEKSFKAVFERASRAREFTSDNLFYWMERVSNKTALVQSFVEHGVSLDGVDQMGFSPVCAAIWNNNFEALRLLVEGGANVRQSTKGVKCLPLAMLAPERSDVHFQEADYLLAHGADANDRDAGGLTPLHHATYAGKTRMMELLLAHGADVNAKVKRADPGQSSFADATPLHMATNYSRVPGQHDEVIKLLLDHGADVNAQNAAGWTLLATIVINRNTLVYALNDQQKHPRPPNPLDRNNSIEDLKATLTVSEDLVRMLIARGADVSLGNNGGIAHVTPIIMAYEMGDTRMVDLLKSKGAFLDPVLLAKRKAIETMGGIMMMGPMH